MNSLDQKQISEIKILIDETKEYLENHLCKKCAEMQAKIDGLEALLVKYSQQ